MPRPVQLPDPVVIGVAEQYGIPPAILQALVTNGGASSTLNMPLATLQAFGMSPLQAQQDPEALLHIASAVLTQQFEQTGSWSSALSGYLTGDPNAYLSPTSSIGGQVESIISTAAINPTLGMDTFTPSDPNAFVRMSRSFADNLNELSTMGGVVTQQSVQQYRAASEGVAVKQGNYYTPQAGQAGAWNTTIVDQLQSAAHNNGYSYSSGQCTWYAARSLGWVPAGLGNAEDWAHNAAHMGFRVSNAPAVGTAVVYGAGTESGAHPYSSVGHVAVVTHVNPDGTFVVSEMNVDGQYVADQRVSTMRDVLGFVQPPAGTNVQQTMPWLQQRVAQNPVTPQRQTGTADTKTPGPRRSIGQADVAHLDPSQVNEFAAQLKGNGIDPDHFAEHFPFYAGQVRRLQGDRRIDVSDYAPVAQMSRSQMMQHLLNQPHATNPSLTVGQYQGYLNQAQLLSFLHTRTGPNPGEVARFAASGVSWNDMNAYYKQRADAQPDVHQQEPDAQPGKVLQLSRGA